MPFELPAPVKIQIKSHFRTALAKKMASTGKPIDYRSLFSGLALGHGDKNSKWQWRMEYSFFRGEQDENLLENSIRASAMIQLLLRGKVEGRFHSRSVIFNKGVPASFLQLPESAFAELSEKEGRLQVGKVPFEEFLTQLIDGESGLEGLYFDAPTKTLFVPRKGGYDRFLSKIYHTLRIEIVQKNERFVTQKASPRTS